MSVIDICNKKNLQILETFLKFDNLKGMFRLGTLYDYYLLWSDLLWIKQTKVLVTLWCKFLKLLPGLLWRLLLLCYRCRTIDLEVLAGSLGGFLNIWLILNTFESIDDVIGVKVTNMFPILRSSHPKIQNLYQCQYILLNLANFFVSEIACILNFYYDNFQKRFIS